MVQLGLRTCYALRHVIYKHFTLKQVGFSAFGKYHILTWTISYTNLEKLRKGDF
jgi:hypothetical protein